MPYPWYDTLRNTDEIRQGDLIPNCPIIIPPTNLVIPPEGEEVEGNHVLDVKTLNTVVVSQSCDLEHGKVEIVLVCPYTTVNQFIQDGPENLKQGDGRNRRIRELKQGHLPSYHVLNRDAENGVPDFLVVDFRNVYGVNFEFLKGYVQPIPSRARLLPPYREHLSQAFARFFMRVGLPNDIVDLN